MQVFPMARASPAFILGGLSRVRSIRPARQTIDPVRVLVLVNLRATKALNRTVPDSLLLQADEVIE
jgi:hypothetical protein